MKKILVLGASGMLGNAVMRLFARTEGYAVTGTARSTKAVTLLPEDIKDCIKCGVDMENTDGLMKLFATAQPNVVINCVGIIKQLSQANDPLIVLSINAMLPHRLANLCSVAGARLIHVSTDCVFSGDRGMYREEDAADARDLYGRSKFLGEVAYPHTITLRTSIIGHELDSSHGLIDWFLSQKEVAKGFNRAIFSGLPAVELARVIRDFIIPRPELCGLYHVSVHPISKYELLKVVAKAYGKQIDIVKDELFFIDRSLDSTRFRQATGYVPPAWPDLVSQMRDFG
jgi:dTDP-4-dehydrorhamnose reductase